jgi:thermitase
VTYYIRRVFEVYELRTRIVAVEVQLGGQWLDQSAASPAIQKELNKIVVGASHDPKIEIALPTDGLLYEAELAHCCSCDCEHEARARLELEKMQLENLNLRLEASRRQKRLEAGELEPFEQAAPVPDQA